MALGLRACLFVSAAAGLAACASDPVRPIASIDYRGDAPGAPARGARQPVIMADATRTAPTAPVAPPQHVPPATNVPSRAAEADGFQLVADLGPSNGVPAVAEAKGVAVQAGPRPGGARRLPADNPSARAIEVQPQDSLYDISRRYAVNLRALIETNGLEPPYMLNAGDTVFLPPPNVHVVQSGETLYSVSRRYNVDTRSLALLNSLGRPWTVWPGDELLLPPLARDQARDPMAAPVVVAPVVVPVAAAIPPPPAPSLKPAQPQAKQPKAVTMDPAGPISLAGAGATAVPKAPSKPAASPPPVPAAKPAPPPVAAKSTPAGGAGREFIWPVSGKVLKGFGPGGDGQRNDGVNISGAKGASILAAAGGEVVYAGSELAGFGNLVLIRHPGGWVTAYAHADTMLVQEGDLVKQGQAIATVGSTGNAGAPQVHFELRKGKEPVDPSVHLPPLQG